MKKLLFLALFVCSILTAQQDCYIHGKYEFELGATEYLFGDNVKLRSEPNTTSKVLELLPIASSVEILEKTDKSIPFNGYDSPWYKVNYQGKTGYILGGLIALANQNITEETYLVALEKKGDDVFAKTRLVKADAPYIEVVNKLITGEFSIKAFDNRGVEEIVNMLHISYIAEACGVEGGGLFLFNNGRDLIKAFEYSQVADAGVYWYNEEYIFPTDENGVPSKIVFKKETGSYQDEATNWLEIEKMERELEWKDNQLMPYDYLRDSR